MGSNLTSKSAKAKRQVGRGETRVFVNAGCGPEGASSLPPYFECWRQVRVDIDPSTNPDMLTNITDLSGIPDAAMHAVWSSHCFEHLYAHEVPIALSEFRRVLREDGFACIVVPDIQAIANQLATDRLDETIYESPSGPVTAHDMIWGFGPALASGKTAMAHHCGFTPALFMKRLTNAGFEEVLLRRKISLEVVALALRHQSESAEQREQLLSGLGF